ncbi:MAG: hypothetical protein ACTSXH_18650 [Promethearchaeota archaeon]
MRRKWEKEKKEYNDIRATGQNETNNKKRNINNEESYIFYRIILRWVDCNYLLVWFISNVEILLFNKKEKLF